MEKLEFDVTIIPYDGDSSWIEDTIFRIKETWIKMHCRIHQKIVNIVISSIIV
jgi:hypothetical protein